MASAIVPTLTYAAQAKAKLDQWRSPSERPFPIFVYHRMGFGATPHQCASLDTFHFEKYVEAQLYPEKIKDDVCEAKLKEAKLESFGKSLKECWKDYKVAVDDLKKKEELKGPDKINEGQLRQTPARDVETASWIRAIYSEKQLQELLVQFWHDHFSVNGFEYNIAVTMAHYDRDVIRPHVFGNFHELLTAVAKSPAMLLYLDNGLNQSANPNENFARELFELHTLGADHYLGTLDRKKVLGFEFGKSKGYVDGDVYEAARAFTGWRENSNQKDATNTGEFNYYDAWHDRFQKIVLGHSIPEYQPPEKDGLDVLQYVATHPATAEWICKKLCRRLVSDHPSQALIERAKKVFIENQKSPEQMKKVVRTILLSSEFKTEVPDQSKLKRPFEYAVSLLRGIIQDPASFTPDEEFIKRQNGGGQGLFRWKTPDGYPDIRERWMTTSGLTYRFQLANQILDKKLINLDEYKADGDAVTSLQKRVIGYTSANQTKVMDEFIKDHLSPNEKGAAGPRLKGIALLALMSPELQWK